MQTQPNPGQASSALRGVVIGAGFAGEGHTLALRHFGIDVVAMCGRDPGVTRLVAAKLGIGIASTDWRAMLENVRPDVVAIATPAALRRPVIEAAANSGCHIYCDKPLATNAPEAADLFRIVDEAGIKHAYGATRRYEPSVVWLSHLIREGAIGRVSGVVFRTPTCLAPVLPWSWALVLDQGGGLLNNHFVHLLSILERILSGQVVQVVGKAAFAIDHAPFVPGIHDFRDWSARIDSLTQTELDSAEWRACDADTSYSAEMRIATAGGEVPVSLVSGPEACAQEPSMQIFGEYGTLIARGELSFEVSKTSEAKDSEVPLALPASYEFELPQIGMGTVNRWGALAREFVADIKGDPHNRYLTFRDGWRYQEAIDAIRSGKSRTSTDDLDPYN